MLHRFGINCLAESIKFESSFLNSGSIETVGGLMAEQCPPPMVDTVYHSYPGKALPVDATGSLTKGVRPPQQEDENCDPR